MPEDILNKKWTGGIIRYVHEKEREFVSEISPEVINAVESNDTEEMQEVPNNDVNNDSSIRSKQGTDFNLREMYMQTYPSRDNVFGTTNIENFVKIEMEEGSDNEASDHGVKKQVDGEEETNQE